MLKLIPDQSPIDAVRQVRTLRVRLALAVNKRGGWAVVGWKGAPYPEAAQQAATLMEEPCLCHQLEITVEVPQGEYYDARVVAATGPVS